MSRPEPGSDPTPQLTVVKGDPTEEELAALFVVWASRQSPDATTTAPPDEPRSGWSAYWRSVRAPLQPGPGVWRMSGRP